jgi:hypothetical protein
MKSIRLLLVAILVGCGTTQAVVTVGGDGGSRDADSAPNDDAGLDAPRCEDANAPSQCGYVANLPEGAVPDSGIPLPDGGTSPPMMFENCFAKRQAYECRYSGGGEIGVSDDASAWSAPGCETFCCPGEYAIACSGNAGFDDPPGCRGVGGAAPGGYFLLCCPCL